MKKGKQPLGKQKVITLYILAFGAIVLGFAACFAPAFLSDEHGHYENGWVFMLLFALLEIGGVALLLRILPEVAMMEMEQKLKKYSSLDLSTLESADRSKVFQTFQRHRFRETETGLYRKKVFSFVKDSVCYYWTALDAGNVYDVCDNALNRLERIENRPKNACLLLFVYKPQVTKEDKIQLRDIAAALLTDEAVLPDSSCATMVPVLVDSSTGKGYFLDRHRGISVYAHGCRLLRKYLP